MRKSIIDIVIMSTPFFAFEHEKQRENFSSIFLYEVTFNLN